MCKTDSKPFLNSVVASQHLHLYLDVLGIGASSLCVIHCLLMPLVLALPMCGIQFLHDGAVHPFLAGFVVMFGLTSILPGYRKHRECATLMAMALGLSLVLLATFVIEPALGEHWEMLVITAGNFLIVSAHIRNQLKLSSLRTESRRLLNSIQKEKLI